MKRFSIPVVLSLATLSLLAAVKPTVAAERAMYGAWSGGLGGNYLPFLAGSGHATHLSHSSLMITIDQEEWDSNSRMVLRKLILTARNGDMLFADVSADFNLGMSGVYHATITFTGGTGRFDDGGGAADLLILFDRTQGLFDFALEGTIDY